MDKLIIIGCGWLGKSIAQKALSQGVVVFGSTTREERAAALKSIGVQSFVYQLGGVLPEQIKEQKGAAIIIAVPPSKTDNYPSQLRETAANLELALEPKSIVFCSSTGFYPKAGRFNESSKTDNASSPKIALAEDALGELNLNHLCCLRLGGLFNKDDRHPGRWFANKKELPNGWVNMIHQDDASALALHCAQKQVQGVVNGVAPVKLEKEDFYGAAFKDLNRDIPRFLEAKASKLVESNRIVELGFNFKYPDSREVFK